MGFSIANLTGLATPYAPAGTPPREDKPKAATRKAGSSYDRAKASRATSSGPDMASVYRAYQNTGKPGGMTRADAAAYENAVLGGHIMLPRGAQLRVRPAAPVLPASVVAAYNSHAMDDDPDARTEIKRALDAGEVSLPKGMRLQAPKPRTTGERLGMAARSAVKGLGQIADMASPTNIVARMAVDAMGGHLPGTEELAVGAADALGAQKPESATEMLTDQIIGGAAQGLVTGPLGAVRGMAGRTVLDVVSGGVAGGASESARQAGAGPVGQIVAGLVGGAAPIGSAATAERVAARTRAPKDLPAITAEVPRAAVIDETGNLTPEGQEIAARHGASPDEIVAAYEAPPQVRDATGNDQAPQVLAREATNDTPVVEAPVVREQEAANPPLPNPPADDATPPLPRSVPDAAPDAPLPATALQRVEQAQEFGVDLSRGQATKSFDIQDAESRLRNSNGPEAEQMRQFAARQAEQVKAATEDFRRAFDDQNMTAQDRGNAVQEAIRELRDNGQRGVNAAYKELRELGQAVPLETAGIRNTFEGLMAEADIPEGVKKVMEQEAARYGLIGKVVEIEPGKVTNEANVTTVKLDDGQTIKFRGEPKTLALDNAEDLRQVISKQYQADGPLKLTRELKAAIDDATEEAAVKLAQYEQTGAGVPEAATRAREAHKAQVETFRAKDIVQAIADWKKGTSTAALKPEQVLQQALAKTSDLKRLKTVLLTKPTPKSEAAWRAIQAHGLAKVFDEATARNTNIAGEITDAISGAKLRTAIERFGPDKLKIMLDPDDFNRLMKLRRVIEDATIPIAGTTNPSGSGNLLMRLARDVDNQVTGAFAAAGMAIGGPAGAAIGGAVGRTVGPVVKDIKASRVNAETLEGATNYGTERAATDTGDAPSGTERAASAVKDVGKKTVRAFIDTYSSPRVLAPVLASMPEEPEQ